MFIIASSACDHMLIIVTLLCSRVFPWQSLKNTTSYSPMSISKCKISKVMMNLGKLLQHARIMLDLLWIFSVSAPYNWFTFPCESSSLHIFHNMIFNTITTSSWKTTRNDLQCRSSINLYKSLENSKTSQRKYQKSHSSTIQRILNVIPTFSKLLRVTKTSSSTPGQYAAEPRCRQCMMNSYTLPWSLAQDRIK